MARGAAAARQMRSHEQAPERSLGWLFGLFCGALLALATSFAIVLAVLLAPGLLAHVLDRAHGKPVARTVLLFGACGCVSPLHDLWIQGGGQGMGQALALLNSPSVLATAWIAAAGGWLLSELAPLLTRVVLDVRESARLSGLRAAREVYQAEWDTDPPG